MAEEAGIAGMKTISKYVIGTVIYMLGFITVMTVIFCFKGSVPDGSAQGKMTKCTSNKVPRHDRDAKEAREGTG